MYLLILLYPLLGTIIPMFTGGLLGITGSITISTIGVSLATIVAIIGFYEVILSGSTVSITLGSWVTTGALNVQWSFLFDGLTISMLIPVLIVSTMVHIYSASYMEADPHQPRFFSLLSMFTFWMIILVTGDNYWLLFLGWEGIGVSSYLLIAYWYTRIQAVKSAMEAMIVNRVGDTFLSLGIFWMFFISGSIDYETIYSTASYLNETTLTILGILLLLAAMGKSAQLGLHTWLPLAMEGPTPVSALIHAATLVTAGVYLLLRSSPILVYAPTSLIIITWIGAITTIFAATTGLVQNDIKRVIAYSTCSQMGYLFMALGLALFDVSLFHLVNHAFFKAVLFLSAGGVLHSMADQQDLRRLGGLVLLLPFTYIVILIGSLSLMALPFLTGFYSKDLIIEAGYGAYTWSGHLVYWFGSLTALLTAFYSLRLISLTFLSRPNANRMSYINTHDQPRIVVVPLVILTLFSIGFGYFAKDLFIGVGTDSLTTALLPIGNMHLEASHMIDAEFGPSLWSKLIPLFATLFGTISSILIYNRYSYSITRLVMPNYLYRFLLQKWQYDIVINQFITHIGLWIGYLSSVILDKGLYELIGPHGITEKLLMNSNRISLLDTGKLTDYSLFVMIGFIGFVAIASQQWYWISDTLLEEFIINIMLILFLLH